MFDLVSFADARGVTIIPELDLPGHSGRLTSSGYLIDDPSTQGIGHADVASPLNYTRIEAIIDDMLSVFQSTPYFHIGGDESSAGSRLVPFLSEINQHVRNKPVGERKRLIVWEGFHGAPTQQIPPTGDDRVIVMSWESSYNPPWNLLQAGYTLVNASWKPLYVVGHRLAAQDGGAAIKAWSAETIYSWDSDAFMHW